MKLPRPTHVHVDQGHGGPNDPGAVHGNAVEAMINLAVGQAYSNLLAGEGFIVTTTRSFDVPVSLDQRCALVNKIWQPDLLVSIHANSHTSPGPNGIEIFTSPGQTAADPIAEFHINALRSSFPESRFRTDLSDGDQDKEARFQVLTGSLCPAILVEMAFLSNPVERDWIMDPATQAYLALALCCGTLTWREGK